MASLILPPERIGEFKADWNSGMSVVDMRDKYGYANKSSVSSVARRHNLPRRHEQFVPEVDLKEFKVDWADPTMSRQEIADKYGWETPVTVGKFAARNGLPPRKPGPRMAKAEPGRWVRGSGGIRRFVKP